MALGTNVINKNDILLGTGKLYINSVSVGQLKGDVVLTPNSEYKEFLAGIPQQIVKSIKFKEGATLKASFAELNYTNIANALGTTGVTTTTADITAEEHVMNTGQAIYPSKNRNVTLLVVKVGATTAVKDTDYTWDAVTGAVKRVPASTLITAGATATFAYTYISKAVVTFGGGTSIPEAPCKFVYDSPDGDQRITVEFYLGQLKGGQPITFKEEDYVTNEFEIVATADSSRTAGDQLGNVTYDYYPAA